MTIDYMSIILCKQKKKLEDNIIDSKRIFYYFYWIFNKTNKKISNRREIKKELDSIIKRLHQKNISIWKITKNDRLILKLYMKLKTSKHFYKRKK